MARNLVVYCSSHGTTEKAAQLLGVSLDGEVEVIDLNKKKASDIASYDSIIIGGSIHAGNIQRKLKQFMQKNHEILLTKKLGLFLCCYREGEEAKTQFETVFPQDLRDHAKSEGLFGGEFIFSKMSFLSRKIINKIVGVSTDQSNFSTDLVQEFADRFNHAS
mgnify:CR=1 FL=1